MLEKVKSFTKKYSVPLILILLVLLLGAIALAIFLPKTGDPSKATDPTADIGTQSSEVTEPDATDPNATDPDDFEDEDDDSVGALGIVFGKTGREGQLMNGGKNKVMLYENVDRPDINMFFAAVGKNDLITTYLQNLTWVEGGLYVDGVECNNIPIIKYAPRSYYAYFSYDGFTTAEPVKGTRVSLQGTVTDGIHETKFEPATFEYSGGMMGTWKIVSRERITPRDPDPINAKNIKLYENPERPDVNMFFKVDKQDGIRKVLELLWEWEEGGVYVDGVLTSVPLLKWSSTDYYVYFGFDGLATVEPVKGMKVSIQGTLTDGFNSSEFQPATFQFDGTKWTIVSREKITPKEPTAKHSSDVTISPSTDPERIHDINFFFETDGPTAINKTMSLLWFKDGGIYVDGVLKNVPMVKWTKTGYYIYFSFDGCATAKPTKGTKLSIQGTLSDGVNTVEFNPITVQYDGSVWNVISREEITPEVPIVDADVTIASGYESDWNLRIALANSTAQMNQTSNVALTAIEGGSTRNGEPVSLLGTGVSNEYYFNLGDTPVEGTTVKIGGVYTNGTARVRLKETTYTYSGGQWTAGTGGATISVDSANKTEMDLHLISSASDTLAIGSSAQKVEIDSFEKSVMLEKTADKAYTLKLTSAGVDVKEGTVVCVGGTYQTSASNKAVFAPAAFVYTNDGWESIVAVNLTLNADRKTEKYLFFDTDATDSLKVSAGTWAWFGERWNVDDYGFNVDGKALNVNVYKHAANGYYIESANFVSAVKAGTVVDINGVLHGENGSGPKVYFRAAKFKYDGTSWEQLEVTPPEGWGVEMATPSVTPGRESDWDLCVTLDSIAQLNSIANQPLTLVSGSVTCDGGAATLLGTGTNNVFYFYFGGSPVEGTVVSIEGTFTDGVNTVKCAKKEFTYTDGAWALINQDPTKVTVILDESHKTDKDLTFTVDVTDPMPLESSTQHFCVDGTISSVILYKYTTSAYKLKLADSGISVVEGTVVCIDGICKDSSGKNAIEFTPAAFVYTKDGWQAITVANLTVDTSHTGDNCLFLNTDVEDELAIGAGTWAWFGARWNDDYGFKVDGDPLVVKVYKSDAKQYYIESANFNDNIVAGQTVQINGVLHGADGEGPKVYFMPAEFKFDGTVWTKQPSKPTLILAKCEGAELHVDCFGDVSIAEGEYDETAWLEGGVSINSAEPQKLKVKKVSDTEFVFDFTGITLEQGYVALIEGTFSDGTNQLNIPMTAFMYDGTTWKSIKALTLTVDETRVGEDILFFNVDKADGITVGMENGFAWYGYWTNVDYGFKINGTGIATNLHKAGATLYYTLRQPWDGKLPWGTTTDGMTCDIHGVAPFGSAYVYFRPAHFVYSASLNRWTQE